MSVLSKFVKSWEGKGGPSLAAKIKEAVRSPGPLKPRLEGVVRRIEVQIQSLDKASERFLERDRSIFNRIVDAYTKHNESRANIFANELAEIRKMETMIMHARLALEQIVLRMRTITELGDVAVTLTPVVGVIYNIREGMSAVSPQAERELGEIGNLLSGIVVDAGQVTGTTIDFQTINEDSKKILNEAAVVAEQRMKEKFPELTGLIAPADEETPDRI